MAQQPTCRIILLIFKKRDDVTRALRFVIVTFTLVSAQTPSRQGTVPPAFDLGEATIADLQQRMPSGQETLKYKTALAKHHQMSRSLGIDAVMTKWNQHRLPPAFAPISNLRQP